MKKYLWIIAGIILLHAYQAHALSVLVPSQGGTGIGSAVAGDVGKCLKVLANSPFAYELGTCGGGGGGSASDFTYTVGGQGIYLTPTSTAVGLLTNASSTFVRLNSWNSTSTQATSSYLASLLAFSVSSGTSTLMGGVSAPRVAATSTTASSTFAGGVWSTGSGFRDSTINCTGYGNGGKLTTNANGQFICAADTDTDTDTTQNVPNEFTYTVGANGIYLTPTSTSVGLLTNASSSFTRMTAWLSTSTQATSTSFYVSSHASTSLFTANQASSTWLYSVISNVGSGGFFQTGFADCTGTQKVTYASGNFSCAADVSGSGGSGSNWTFENNNLLYITPTTTVGIIAKASSTILGITSINATSTNATNTSLTVLSRFLVSSGTSTLYGGISAPTFAATSTTASSTFAGGIWVTGSGFRDSTLNCTAYGNGGKLTTNANGKFICDADTDTTGGGGGASDFTYTVGTSGIYLTPTSTLVGLLVPQTASSTLMRLTMNLSTSTQATTTYLNLSSVTSNITVGGGALPSSTIMLYAKDAATLLDSPYQGVGPHVVASSTNTQVEYQVVDFYNGSTTCAQWTHPMPDSWDGGSLQARFYWTATSTNSGNVVWGIRSTSWGDTDDLSNPTLSATTSVTDSFGTAETMHITSYTSAFTPGGTPAAGEMAYFLVCRVQDDSSDTYPRSVRLLNVQVKYNKNQFSD